MLALYFTKVTGVCKGGKGKKEEILEKMREKRTKRGLSMNRALCWDSGVFLAQPEKTQTQNEQNPSSGFRYAPRVVLSKQAIVLKQVVPARIRDGDQRVRKVTALEKFHETQIIRVCSLA